MHAAAIMQRGFALPNKPQVVCTRLAAVRLIAECSDMFPRFRLHPHLLSPRRPAAAAVEAAGAVVECTRPRRAICNPPSATHGEGAHD